MAEGLKDGCTEEVPVEKNPSRSRADIAKTKTEDLGDIRASMTMEDAQYLGERVKKHEDAQ